MNHLKKLLLLIVSLSLSTAAPTATKKAEEVFGKWLEWQKIMPDVDLAKLADAMDDSFVDHFKNEYEKSMPHLANYTNLLTTLTAGHITEHGYVLRSPMNPDFKNNLNVLYKMVNNDMSAFVNFLKASRTMPGATKTGQLAGSSHDIIEQNKALFNVLFANSTELVMQKNLFTVSNRFMDYCFGEKTFPEFQTMLFDKTTYPICRMLYSVSWFNLAGNGWKLWHEDSLKTLKQRADQGHLVVYIAGGSDIYQLIKAGIYNIRNIDPQLPSQPKYYTNDWQFILRGDGADGGIGDKIEFSFEDGRKITMERVGFVAPGTSFKVRIATGDVIQLPHSMTTWAIKDATGKQLGQYLLERRFCQQADFASAPNKTLLMSFNEMYFIALAEFAGGWGITPVKFDDKFDVVIKQLSKPMTKQNVVNMHLATLLNTTDFKFIALGTCIN